MPIQASNDPFDRIEPPAKPATDLDLDDLDRAGTGADPDTVAKGFSQLDDDAEDVDELGPLKGSDLDDILDRPDLGESLDDTDFGTKIDPLGDDDDFSDDDDFDDVKTFGDDGDIEV